MLVGQAGNYSCRFLILTFSVCYQTYKLKNKKETDMQLYLISVPGPPPFPPGTSWCMWWRLEESTSSPSPTPPTPSTPSTSFSSSYSTSNSTYPSKWILSSSSQFSSWSLKLAPTSTTLCGLSNLHSPTFLGTISSAFSHFTEIDQKTVFTAFLRNTLLYFCSCTLKLSFNIENSHHLTFINHPRTSQS